MVSPPYKGGYGVFLLAGAGMAGEREGEGVVFDSVGHFVGQPVDGLAGAYLARRASSGWVTSPLLPPPTIAANSGLNDISPTLQGLYVGEKGPNELAAEEEGNGEFLFHDLYAPDDGANFLTPFTTPPFGVPLERLDGKPYKLLGSIGSDARFCHVIFGINSLGALLPAARRAVEQLYEIATGAPGCAGKRALHLVAVENSTVPGEEPKLIDPSCKPEAGGHRTRFNAVAAEGSEIFFTTEKHAGCEAPGNPAVLFVRLNGERTVEISTPLAAACTSGPCTSPEQKSAEFVGANEAGTRVYFTTSRSLVTGDIDTGNDLYMAQIGCPAGELECEPARREVNALIQVSRSPIGEAGEVQGVLVLSADGGRVYFVAQGVLSTENGEGATPVKGADNLYVYDSEDGSVHFIAALCSGPAQSGETVDRSCPVDLATGGQGKRGIRNDFTQWTDRKEVQTTGDGTFLVFASYGRLVGGDTDNGKDIYRYDAQTETLDRVSVGEKGYDANGNGDGASFDAELPILSQLDLLQNDELNYRAITEDGTRIVFETTEPLSPHAVNGLLNAYEWHKTLTLGSSAGNVSLVSTGEDEEPVGANNDLSPGEIMITPSGRDIFFTTVQGLLPQDRDGAKDVYDARLGEGFPAETAERRQCEGDACQGPLTNPAPLLVPGSVSQAPGENLPPSKRAKVKKRTTRKKTSPKKTKARKASRVARGGRKANSGRAAR
jgi:hypothetical protein